MKVRINENYYIDIDERNHTLKEVRQTKEGKPYEKAIGYYSSVYRALEAYNLNNLAQEDEELTIAEYIRLYKEGLDDLVEACKGA